MSSIAAALKAEIIRISRKEIKSFFEPIRSSNIKLKRAVSELKEKAAILEGENKKLLAAHKNRQPEVSPEEAKKARFSSKGIRSLRKKLNLTRDEFARLVNTSSQTVYLWENKAGAPRLRSATAAALVAIRGIGSREAKKRLEEMGEPAKKIQKKTAKKATKKAAKKKVSKTREEVKLPF